MQKFLMGVSVLVLTACGGGTAPTVQVEPDVAVDVALSDGDVSALHARTLTLDTHIDIPLTYMTEVDPKWKTELQVDLPKLGAGKLDSGFWIIYTPQGALSDIGYAAGEEIAETRYRAIQKFTDSYPEKVKLAHTAQDVHDIVDSGRHAVLMGMENAYPLGESVDKVPLWARRGVRYMGLTHFGHNQFGDSSNPNPLVDTGPRHTGLSALGKDLILALNDNGIMVDVSHAGRDTMMQAADLSRTPIIASHSGVKAIGDSPRNLDDDQLRKIRDVGGVAQMVALGVYVKPLTQAQLEAREAVRQSLGLTTPEALAEMSEATEAAYEAALEPMYAMEPLATVSDFVDHIDHAVSVAGVDHVGIASDFDGGGGIIGWTDASETENVTAELVRRGYSEADIGKIWGGNLLRVLEAVERSAL